MTAPGVGAADLAAYGLGGAGPVVDLADALAHGCFDGDDGGDAVELTADALEAKDERGDPIDAHAAAITALAGEASRVALNAVPLDDDEAVVDGDPEPPPPSSVAHRFVCATRHLARAAVRARWARHWRQMAAACAHLWNAVVSLWVSPLAFRSRALAAYDEDLGAAAAAVRSANGNDGDGDDTVAVLTGLHGFADQPQLDPAPFVAAAHALLDFFELLAHVRYLGCPVSQCGL